MDRPKVSNVPGAAPLPPSLAWVPPILVGIAVLALVYYILCSTYVGWHLTGMFIVWPILAGVCALAAALWPTVGPKLAAHRPLGIAVAVVGALALIAGTLLLGVILRAGHSRPPEDLDTLIVLGTYVSEDGPGLMLRQRLDTAYTYAAEHPDTLVIVTGGQGPDEPDTEGAVSKAYLVGKGLEPERIRVEDRSTSTRENFALAAPLIPESSVRLGVVTSDFHMYRSVRLARSVLTPRVHAVPAPADRLLTPHYLVRELAAVVKERLVGNLG